MRPPARYDHALRTMPERCDGCMKCLKACPSQALRVRGGRPLILEDLCIDCGSCITACPRKAILPDTDTVLESPGFRARIAVPSLVLYSQFGLGTSPAQVHMSLHQLGFDAVADVAAACRIDAMAVQEHLARKAEAPRPLISSMCPAVVRLIQVRYPELVAHVIPFEPPRELAAREAKIKLAREHGLDLKDVGAFYISPCPAKSISIRQPAEKERSFLDGVIGIADIYRPMREALADQDPAAVERFEETGTFACGRGWERTGMMSRSLNIRHWLAVSGIEHVARILDDIEGMRLQGIDFVEANACHEGCVGGALTVENVYVARTKTMMLEQEGGDLPAPSREWVRQLYGHGYFLMQNRLRPRPRRRRGPIAESIRFMRQRDDMAAQLPGIDCGVCGCPTCATLAEDVLEGSARLEQCPFLGRGNSAGGPGSPR